VGDRRAHQHRAKKKRLAAPGGRTLPLKVPRQERAVATVQALLDATSEILVKEGYDAANTNRNAARAGVSIASLYQYFPSKEALVAALIDRHIARMAKLLGGLLEQSAGLPMPDAIALVVRGLFEAYGEDEALHRELLRNVPQLERLNPAVEARRAAAAQLAAWFSAKEDLHAYDPVGAARVTVNVVYGTLEGGILLEQGLIGDRSYVEYVVRMLVRNATAALHAEPRQG
jgi:AcrR family transcriptional regulator